MEPICECDQACCEWCDAHGDTGHRNPVYDMGWPISFYLVSPT